MTLSLPEVTRIEIAILVFVEDLECLLEVCITTMAVLAPLLLYPFIPHHQLLELLKTYRSISCTSQPNNISHQTLFKESTLRQPITGQGNMSHTVSKYVT